MWRQGFWLGWLVSLGLLVSGWVFTPTAAAFTDDQKLFLQAWRIVNQSYLDATFNHQNWWHMRQQYLRKPFADREAAYGAIDSLLGTLDDPFTRLLRPEEYRSLQVSTTGELSGVGLQVDLDPRSQKIRVVAPIAGSPAEAAGIQAGDFIVAIDGQDTAQFSLEEAANRMRGQQGTTVTLTLQSVDRNQTHEISIVRDRIALNPVTTVLDTQSAAQPIGYVRLAQFSANASQELTQGFQNLAQAGATAYILDLRNNPGGLLQAGIEIADLLLDDQPIVYTVNRQGVLDSFMGNHPALNHAPLAVLVNQGTASASEILAGALQDNDRAQLVGEQTFGKGLIQSLFELPDDSGLAVTVAKYETPNHHDIHRLGITPDVQVPLTAPLNPADLATARDEQYQAAIALFSQTPLSTDAIADAA
ncbi:MAG: PDZ domain-containing protein [Spirulina sp. SIO3F2]|nr:PDZ domain-containing protein [Spirulina sp. SIO3F2]